MGYQILLDSLASGEPSEFDKTWLVDYDPSRPGRSPSGEEMLCVLRTSHYRSDAKVFATAKDAWEYWRKSYGIRLDGQENRPLTAYSIEVLGEDQEPF